MARFRLIIEIPLHCPSCGQRHVDEERDGERWDRRAHTTHRCRFCGQHFDVYASGSKPPETETDILEDIQRREESGC